MKQIECRAYAIPRLQQHAIHLGLLPAAGRLAAVWVQHEDDDMVIVEVEPELAEAWNNDPDLFIAGHVLD